MEKKKIAVFCGSKFGTDDSYEKAARAFGKAVGERGCTLIFGGCDTGLMQAVSHAAAENGGKVISVRIRGLLDAFDASIVSEDEIMENVQERKRRLITLADACIALPGGFGTLDEIGDVLSMTQLQDMKKPLGLLNIKGYFDGLLHFADTMEKEGFLSPSDRQLLKVADDPTELLDEVMQ